MEKEMTTKERIINESLKLFSAKGYDGVSMREIAAAVGIKGASLYNHFKGKEDIFAAIFEEVKNQYESVAFSMNVPTDESAETISLYHGVGEEQLLQMAEMLFGYFAKNEFVSLFRRLLMAEQNKSKVAAKCFREYYLEQPFEYQSRIFAGLQAGGDFRGFDPDMLALHFYSAVYFILCRYDAGFPYEECLKELKRHVSHFRRAYIPDA